MYEAAASDTQQSPRSQRRRHHPRPISHARRCGPHGQRRAGGDPQKWARTIYAFAGSGHPQLVDARVAGLEQRGWDEKELLADFVPLTDAPNDMEEERKAVRSRLLGELQPNAIELLLRLSLLQGNFDRPMALVTAEHPVRRFPKRAWSSISL